MKEIRKGIKMGPTPIKVKDIFSHVNSQETYPSCSDIIHSKELLNLTMILLFLT